MRTKQRLVPNKKKKGKPKKYRDKTLREHAADGVTVALSKISDEDQKMYHVQRDKDGKEINEFSVIGTEEEMRVNGSATIGYFDVVLGGKHFLNRRIEYSFTASVKKDNLNQPTIVVSEFSISGIDDLEGPTDDA